MAVLLSGEKREQRERDAGVADWSPRETETPQWRGSCRSEGCEGGGIRNVKIFCRQGFGSAQAAEKQYFQLRRSDA